MAGRSSATDLPHQFLGCDGEVCPVPSGSPTISAVEPDYPARRWHRIYVGILTQVVPHPNADREVVVEVDAGWGCLTVVTGGPHVTVGHKVAIALPGARVLDADSDVPRLRKLKKGRIRGVLSEGMLCSAKELGLSDDHSCIYVLPPDAPLGAPLASWLETDSGRVAA
jgi:phenylalanyl-tRNA synthetase beta chain